MNGDEKKDKRLRQKERIDTQIHRRRKVKAFSPLESEWESSQAGSSSCGVTNKSKEMRRVMPDRELQQEPNHSTYSPLSDHHT